MGISKMHKSRTMPERSYVKSDTPNHPLTLTSHIGNHPAMTDAEIETLPPVLRVPQVAELLDVGTDSIYEAVKRGEIPALRIGRCLRFGRDAILRLIDPEQ